MNNKPTDVVILGSNFRGLWLAAELVRLGWSVTWIQVHGTATNKRQGGFIFDDWAWQVGVKTKQAAASGEFIEKVIQPELQDIAVQILTPQGPLELSGPATSLGVHRFFKKSSKAIEDYLGALKNLDAARDAGIINDQPGFAQTDVASFRKSVKAEVKVQFDVQRKNLAAAAQKYAELSKKILKRPLGERWVLDWLGSVRQSRAVTSSQWILKWKGILLNPGNEIWLLKDSLEVVTERAISWAEKQGVVIKRHALVADVGVEGRLATGVEIQGLGFVETKRMIIACSYQTLKERLPKFAEHLESPLKEMAEKNCWVRCGFLLKPHMKPEGLLEFSSFVMDPHMPLVESNMGLLRWKTGVEGAPADHLTVWVNVPFGELKRRSFLMNLTEMIQKNLSRLLPWFDDSILAVLPFEEYFHSPQVGHDDLAIVFNDAHEFSPLTTRLKNVWLMGPDADVGLEILSRLQTEFRLLTELSEIRKKELKKSDRTIHPARDGQGLDTSK